MLPSIKTMTQPKPMRAVIGIGALMSLAACDDAGNFSPQDFFSSDNSAQTEVAAPQATGEFIEKDVEAPDVFFAEEAGLWLSSIEGV